MFYRHDSIKKLMLMMMMMSAYLWIKIDNINSKNKAFDWTAFLFSKLKMRYFMAGIAMKEKWEVKTHSTS